MRTADIIRAAIALAVLTHLIDTEDDMVLIASWIADTTVILLAEMQTWTTARIASATTEVQTADIIHLVLSDGS